MLIDYHQIPLYNSNSWVHIPIFRHAQLDWLTMSLQ